MNTTLPHWVQLFHLLIELGGTLAFAMSGILAAARKWLDAVGVFVVAFITAFGGGTLRDILLDQRSFFWVRQVEWVWVVLGLCAVSMLLLKKHHFAITERAIEWPDALGLGLFAATGVHQALAQNMPVLIAVMMGVVTGVFGGVLRDMVCNEIPTTFKDRSPYALCAFAGAWVYVLGWTLDLSLPAAVSACVLVTAGLRVLSVLGGWKLPDWNHE